LTKSHILDAAFQNLDRGAASLKARRYNLWTIGNIFEQLYAELSHACKRLLQNCN